MAGIDLLVLVVYLVGLVTLGGILTRRIKSSADLFAAGGESPWWMAGISGYMTMFSSGTFVVWGGIAFKSGTVGIAILVMLGVAAWLVGFFLAKVWKEIGVTTAAEYIELRYGQAAVQLYSWFGMFVRMIGVGVALYAISVILAALIPVPAESAWANAEGTLNVNWAILVCGAVVILYTITGGMWAILMADVLQFLVLTVSVVVVVGLIFSEVGGVGGFIDKAPAGFFVPWTDEFPPLFLAGWVIVHFFKIGGEWAFVQRFLSVPDERSARKAAFLFGTLFMISPILWMIPPMVYRVIDPGANPEQAYILACERVLPTGMVGFLMASMFAATASMADSEINVFAGAFTREIYGRVLRPGSSERHLVAVGRCFTLVLGLVVIGIAIGMPYFGGVEKVILQITGMLVAPLVLPTIWGLFSKKVGKAAVWGPFCVSLVTIGIIKWILPRVTTTGWVADLSGWFQEHSRTTETCIIGILVPVITLTVIELFSRGESAGYAKVRVMAEQARRNAEAKKKPTISLMIIGLYILIIAAGLLAIGIANEQGRGIIITLGILLMGLGVGILLTRKKRKED